MKGFYLHYKKIVYITLKYFNLQLFIHIMIHMNHKKTFNFQVSSIKKLFSTFMLKKDIFSTIIVFLLYYSALEPSSLLRAIYPVLSSYSSPDKQAYPRHSLSRAALTTSNSPIFFLDAFTILIVYYTAAANDVLPFPLPHNCKH